MRIPRHAFSPLRDSKSVLQKESARLPERIASVELDANNLSLVATCALDIVRFGWFLTPDNPELPKALRTAAQALTALFLIDNARGASVRFFLGERGFTLAGEIDESIVEPSRWLDAYWLGLICRSTASLNALGETPLARLRASSTKHPEYRYLLIDALQASWRRRPDVGDKLVAALAATDPDRPDIRARDYVLYIDVPVIELFYHALARDAAFATALPKAVEHHKAYWSATAERARNHQGFISVELTALAVMGLDRGLAADVDSDYLVTRLAGPSWT